VSEYTEVEKPFLDQLARQGWTVIDQGSGVPQQAGPSLRHHFREWLLPGVFDEAVRDLNRTIDGPSWLTDAQLDDFIREHVESAYHPCGTARMGRRSDPMAVVDPECRVIGVEGLRVADSSIFPQVTNGNLNGPSIMTGEKASDHILGRRLPRSNLGPVMSQNWQTSQR
jgi:hypothetical protein